MARLLCKKQDVSVETGRRAQRDCLIPSFLLEGSGHDVGSILKAVNCTLLKCTHFVTVNFTDFNMTLILHQFFLLPKILLMKLTRFIYLCIGKITLRDLKRCRMAHIFYDTFFNLEKYLDHEQRDPFAVQKVLVFEFW